MTTRIIVPPRRPFRIVTGKRQDNPPVGQATGADSSPTGRKWGDLHERKTPSSCHIRLEQARVDGNASPPTGPARCRPIIDRFNDSSSHLDGITALFLSQRKFCNTFGANLDTSRTSQNRRVAI